MKTFHTVPLVTINRIQPDDYIRWHELEGTVSEFVPHSNGYTFSLWLRDAIEPWMNDFEWILTGSFEQPLPRVKKEYKEWLQIFTV